MNGVILILDRPVEEPADDGTDISLVAMDDDGLPVIHVLDILLGQLDDLLLRGVRRGRRRRGRSRTRAGAGVALRGFRGFRRGIRILRLHLMPVIFLSGRILRSGVRPAASRKRHNSYEYTDYDHQRERSSTTAFHMSSSLFRRCGSFHSFIITMKNDRTRNRL